MFNRESDNIWAASPVAATERVSTGKIGAIE